MVSRLTREIHRLDILRANDAPCQRIHQLDALGKVFIIGDRQGLLKDRCSELAIEFWPVKLDWGLLAVEQSVGRRPVPFNSVEAVHVRVLF